MFKKVLIAIDDSGMRDKIFKTAREFFSSKKLDITVLHVAESSGAPSEFVTADEEGMPIEVSGRKKTIEEDKKDMLETAKSGLEGVIDGKVKTLLLTGAPHRLICETAKDGGYDLLVIGFSRGLKGLVVPCSTAYYVMHNVPCSTLLIK